MKRNILILFILMPLLLNGMHRSTDSTDVTVEIIDNVLTIGNGSVQRIFSLDDNKIIPVSFYCKSLKRELLSDTYDQIWFELHVNNVLVTNTNPIWVFQDYSLHKLANGGTEVEFAIRAIEAPLIGLELVFHIQLFPGTVLVREHLDLRATGDSPLAMSYMEGSVHVIFPRYEFIIENERSQTKEIRIASWNKGDVLDVHQSEGSYDERAEEHGWRIGRNLLENYMYHPRFIDIGYKEDTQYFLPGPIIIQYDPVSKFGWFGAYEHGAPDGDPDQEFIVIDNAVKSSSTSFAVRYREGCYFNGEELKNDKSLSLNWVTIGFFHGSNLDDGYNLIWHYLYSWITEHHQSRQPMVYYNTWGMQRDEQEKGNDPREILTIERVLRELEYAKKLGIDLFVLDDGWQDNFGDWNPNPERYPVGLEPLKDRLQENNITFGIWLAVLAADTFSTLVDRNPDWLIRDEDGAPVIGRWDKYVNCFVSDYRDYFVAISKRLIDQGVRYFKWDGIDKHVCDSPFHHHGGPGQTPEERRKRYAYELIRYVTEAAGILRAYHPDVVIEFDVTEPHRNIGLSFLSEGRYFWMNNGASWYGDRSQYRAKSMRHIPNLYGSIIPSILMTYANFPHNHPIYFAQRYNINSSFIGGLGFWGNLTDMSEEELNTVGEYTDRTKLVYKTVSMTRPEISGSIGGSPEIYTHIDRQNGTGQIIAFSGSALQYEHTVANVNSNNILGVLRNAYAIKDDTLRILFSFPMADVSREAIVLSNDGNGIGIQKSTSWLKSAELQDKTLSFINGEAGCHVIIWDKENGVPIVTSDDTIRYSIKTSGDDNYFIITIETLIADCVVNISKER
jgi:hypothetical protein